MTKRKILAQQMFQHVALWHESGMSTVEYAKQIGVSKSKLRYWIEKLENKETKKETDFNFIDLGRFSKDSDIASDWDEQSPRRHPQITLNFPNGLCLKIY